MVRSWAIAAALVVAWSGSTPGEEPDEVIELRFGPPPVGTTSTGTLEGYLIRVDDTVWHRNAIITVPGMVGLIGGAPVHRLVPDVADRLEPLVVRFDGEFRGLGGGPDAIHFGPLPTEHFVALVRLRVVYRVAERGDRSSGKGPVLEVREAHLEQIEFQAGWIQLWRNLDRAIGHLAAIPSQDPEDFDQLLAKRERVREAVARGTRAYEAMVRFPVSETLHQMARAIDPDVEIVREERAWITRAWGRWFRRWAVAHWAEVPESLRTENDPIYTPD